MAHLLGLKSTALARLALEPWTSLFVRDSKIGCLLDDNAGQSRITTMMRRRTERGVNKRPTGDRVSWLRTENEGRISALKRRRRSWKRQPPDLEARGCD